MLLPNVVCNTTYNKLFNPLLRADLLLLWQKIVTPFDLLYRDQKGPVEPRGSSAWHERFWSQDVDIHAGRLVGNAYIAARAMYISGKASACCSVSFFKFEIPVKMKKVKRRWKPFFNENRLCPCYTRSSYFVSRFIMLCYSVKVWRWQRFSKLCDIFSSIL